MPSGAIQDFPLRVEPAGLTLPGTPLWLDALRPRRFTGVSGADVPHAGAHRLVLCTEDTAVLLRARGARPRTQLTPYDRRIALGPLSIRLLPAGRLRGAAQFLVEWQGVRLLYAGRLGGLPLPTAEPAVAVPADILVLDTTCAAPDAMPAPTVAPGAALAAFAERTAGAGATPVVVVPDGPAGQPDVLFWLGAAGFALALPPRLLRLAAALAERGVALGPVRALRPRPQPGEVVVVPAQAAPSRTVLGLVNVRTLRVVPPGAPPTAAGLPADETLCWQAEAGAAELLAFAASVGPRRVCLFGPHDRALEGRFRAAGFAAEASSARGQLSLL